MEQPGGTFLQNLVLDLILIVKSTNGNLIWTIMILFWFWKVYSIFRINYNMITENWYKDICFSDQ